MANRPSRSAVKEALLSSAALVSDVPVADQATVVDANIPNPHADQSNVPAIVLPSAEANHAEIEAVFNRIMNNERDTDYARQMMARLLMDRHAIMLAAGQTLPTPHDLAEAAVTPNVAGNKYYLYLDALAAEYSLKDPAKLTNMTELARNEYTGRVRNRCERALRLFVYIEWLRVERPNEPITWDDEGKRWLLHPNAFLAPDFYASGTMLVNPITKEPRSVLPLEYVDSSEHFFVSKKGSLNVTINLSLDQLEHSVRQHIRLKITPQSAGTSEATPSRQRRAARQPNAAKPDPQPLTTTPEDRAIAAEDSDTPEATAPTVQTDRAYYLNALDRALGTVEKLLMLDVLSDLSWSDLKLTGVNSMSEIAMVIDRMNAKADGKPAAYTNGKPDKVLPPKPKAEPPSKTERKAA